MAARILIVTNGPLSRNPRVVKEAATLGAAGHEVSVLTVRDHPASEPLDAALVAGAPYRRRPLDLLPGFGTSGPVVFARRLQLWAARKFARHTGLGSIHALGPARSLWLAASRQPADLTIVHNEIGHWTGLRLLSAGRRVCADIEDWHSEDLLPADRRGRPLARLRTMERELLHRAGYVTTTSEALASALHTRYAGRRPVVITNSFPLQPAPAADLNAAAPAFFWFSQTLGPGRGLEAFVAAWTRTHQPSRLVLLGADHSGTADRLRAALPVSFRERLTVLSPVPPDELPALIARHDLGLALEETAIPSRDLTITNKILQYLNAGLALVATGTAGQREVLAHAGNAGLIINPSDAAGTARQLDALLADRAALLDARRAARRLAETTYCWEREAPKLLALVSATLAGPS